jgi:putative addiction module killer protein
VEKVFYVKSHDKYVKWRNKLKDVTAKARIARRIKQIEEKGYFGDQEYFGDDVWEMRVHCGPGYRLYYTRQGDKVVLLLCGGDKSTQADDIKLAKQLAKEVKSGTGK